MGKKWEKGGMDRGKGYGRIRVGKGWREVVG